MGGQTEHSIDRIVLAGIARRVPEGPAGIMMKRLTSASAFAALLSLAWHLSADKPGQAFAQAGSGSALSGNGKYKFRVLYNSAHLPAEAKVEKVLKAAHGGFAIDRRPGKGEIYFSLPGAGIVRISSDLKSTAMLDTNPEMRDTNMHNALFWQAKDGTPFLTFPGNAVGKVYTTSIDGKLIHTLNAPPGFRDMGHPVATDYFTGRGNFIPTDVEQLDGLFYIPTGYSNLDFVLTAKIESTSPFKADWHDLAFGGRQNIIDAVEQRERKGCGQPHRVRRAIVVAKHVAGEAV